MILRSLALAVLIGLATPAVAQQAAPTPIAPHGCAKPDEHPGRLASDLRRNAWVKSANAYLECLKKYVQEQQAVYNKIAEQAKPYLEAVNGAIEEYNKAAAQFKADQEGGK